ncbi:DEAD/DEAH box helicase family protein [Actinobacillus pleuropneumoniae]|uniref:DEAD/DEAH box helicase family protein n=1 Tax=Actinobacillus pleuropneumoniae TaxID=715 RepID=UPI003AAF71B7
MSHNFAFLKPYSPSLAELGGLAEALIYIDAGSSVTRLRGFVEELVKEIYQREKLNRQPQASFFDLLEAAEFKAMVAQPLLDQLHLIRKVGNLTAHGKQVKTNIAYSALQVAHKLAIYMAVRYYNFPTQKLPTFLEPSNAKWFPYDKQAEIDLLEEKRTKLEQEIAAFEAKRAEQAQGFEMLSTDDLALRQQQSVQVAEALEWNEAETRANLINLMLVEANWNLHDTSEVGVEVVVSPFPANKSNKGAADYVLWGKDGKPLAVIEAKKASRSVVDGRDQAKMYADALEHMHGQRPVIFHTNGFETYIWDDVFYNSPRRIFSFYDRDSLEKLHFQRQFKQDLTQDYPSRCNEIAERNYQTAAIKSVAENFVKEKQRRKALIVQATGTGKTRVAIAFTHLLLAKNWAKRVLFLCDRRELRNQASEAFKAFLATEPRCVIGEYKGDGDSRIDPSARVFISTYPAMMNQLNLLNTGFFDLIIADESHRSVYNKYRDIFDHFDALQLGLTATPVGFVSRNTYELFGCEDQTPTFSFSLEEAWQHEPPYLCRFKVKDITTEFLREGIHYSQLTPEQKRQLEDDLGTDFAENASFNPNQIGRDIFSKSTDSLIIKNLMENGLKDENGTIGKTIIFAQSQKHAEHLNQIFCELYPQFGAKMCKVIHHGISHVDTVLAEFKQAKSEFKIAISVDMMDTGIDVPEVLNLVFAKTVHSYVKFWQMIGRGTRLCKNLFGQGKDKTEFLIFDHYQNFKYFEEEYEEPTDLGNAKPLYQSLFEARLSFAQAALAQFNLKGQEISIALLREDVDALPRESIAVKREIEQIAYITQSGALQKFNEDTQNRLAKYIAPLMGQRVLSNPEAVKFDRLFANLQSAFLQKSAEFTPLKQELIEWLSDLAMTLEIVKRKQAEIEQVLSESYWQTLSVERLETSRITLREIAQYRVLKTGPVSSLSLKTKTEDGKLESVVREPQIPEYATGYKSQFQALFKQFFEHPVIQKIRLNQQVSQAEIDSLLALVLAQHSDIRKEHLSAFYGDTVADLNRALREIVGLDAEAINQHFMQFTKNHKNLTAMQVKFIDLLQTEIARHGAIKTEQLFAEPFIKLNSEGLLGVFNEQQAEELIQFIQPYILEDMRAA